MIYFNLCLGVAHKVEVQVIGLKIFECLVEALLDMVGVVVGVPQLAGDLKIENMSSPVLLQLFTGVNLRRIVRAVRPTSSNHFRPRARFGSMPQHQCDGIHYGARARPRLQPHGV